MADDDFSFEIKANADQALRVEVQVVDGLDKISDKAKKTGGDVTDAMDGAADSIGRIVEALALIEGARQLEEMVDGYTEMSNRLRVVATDQSNLNGLLQATLSVAQDTRTSWDDVVSTYQRLSNVTKALGLSQQDVLDLEREMAEAGKVSGASARESGMAMAELTHAFATGVVQGREFRVLMRDVPQMMHELQVASGKTSSEFAEMGKHGQITAQLLIDWFGKAKQDISDKFGQTVPTISDELTRLHNAAEQFFGSTATGTGVMRALTDAMNFVIEHFETFGKVLLGVGEALLGLYVIEKVIGLVKALTAAVAANPLGALVIAATTAVMVLRQFGDQIDIDAGGVAKLSDVFEVLWDDIKKVASAVVDFVENAWSKLTSAFSGGLDSEGIELSLRNVLLFIASFADAAIGIFRFIGDSIVTIFGGIGTIIAKGFENLINDILGVYNKLRGIADELSGNDAKRMDIRTASSAAVAKQATDFALAQLMPKGQMNDGERMQAEMALLQQGGSRNAEFAALRDKLFDQLMSARFEAAGVSAPSAARVDFGLGTEQEQAHAFLQKFRDDWKKDIDGTTVVKDIVSDFMDSVDKHAAERAKNAKPADQATVSTAKGPAEPVAMTDKQLAALRKLENELRAIMEQSNPVVAAQEKLAHAQDILNQAVGAGLISYAQAETAMSNYRAKLADVLDPFGAMVTKLVEQTSALRDTAKEQTIATEMEKLADEARKKGIELTESQNKELLRLVKNLEDQKLLKQEEHAQYDAIQGPVEKYQLALRALNDLYAKAKINATAYTQSVDAARLAYLRASQEGNTLAGGLERGWLAVKQQVMDVGSAVENFVVKQFGALNDAIVTLTTTGKEDWSKMIDAMMADLTRLLLQMEEAKIISAIAPGGVSLPGHATGGSWTVSGSGGTDSQVVAFRATPGERVTVATPEQQQAAAAGRKGGQRSGGTHVHVHYDPRELLSVLDTPGGHATVVNVLRKNPGALRSILQR